MDKLPHIRASFYGCFSRGFMKFLVISVEWDRRMGFGSLRSRFGEVLNENDLCRRQLTPGDGIFNRSAVFAVIFHGWNTKIISTEEMCRLQWHLNTSKSIRTTLARDQNSNAMNILINFPFISAMATTWWQLNIHFPAQHVIHFQR